MEKNVDSSINSEPANNDTNESFFGMIEADIATLIIESNELKAKIYKDNYESKKKMKKLLLRIIDVPDAFDRVFANIEEKKRILEEEGKELDKQTLKWLKSFTTIRKIVNRLLTEVGVAPIEALNKKATFHHEIIETKEIPGLEDETIIEEAERGYLWYSEVLKQSKVIVVKNS